MGLKALVTGGTGFIGSNLIYGLIEKGWEVYALVRRESSIGYKRLNGLESINYIYAEDIFNNQFQELKFPYGKSMESKNMLPQFDVCFHLASYGVDYNQQDIYKLIDGNLRFTINILNFCKLNKTKKVINTGSCFEYGTNENDKIKEDHNINPQSLYGAAKASTIIMSNSYAKKNDIPLITIRPFGIYGEKEGIHKLVPQIMKSIILKEVMNMTGGDQVRDYLYVKDLIDAYILLAISEVPLYESFNVCSGEGIQIKSLVEKVVSITGSSFGLFKLGTIPYRKNEVMYFVGENSKLKNYTGWIPKYTIEHGLKKTYEWYERNLEELV